MSREQKEGKLKEVFFGKHFSEADISRVLNLSQSNAHYYRYKLLKQKKITRIARGKYKFLSEQAKRKQKAISKDLKTPLIEYIRASLMPVSQEHNKQFVMTSTSMFNNFYPLTNYITIYVENDSSKLFLETLSTLNLDFVILDNPKKEDLELLRDNVNKRNFIILREKNYFYGCKEGLASVETAFVDYYFEVSRNKLPLTNKTQEILDYLMLHAHMNISTILRYAKERGIRKEIEELFADINVLQNNLDNTEDNTSEDIKNIKILRGENRD
jgi:hypothetical protein